MGALQTQERHGLKRPTSPTSPTSLLPFLGEASDLGQFLRLKYLSSQVNPSSLFLTSFFFFEKSIPGNSKVYRPMSVKRNQREVPSWLPVSFRAMNKGFREKVRVLSDVSPAAKEKEGMGQRWKSFSQFKLVS